MANVKISGLPAASAVAGTNEFEINEAGTSKKVTGSQIASYVESTLSYLDAADIGVSVQGYDADIPTVAASQAEMEAGTEAALRSMSPLRVAQAIAALAPSGGGVLTSDTAKASTSGTSVDFTGIPTWANRVTMVFDGVSTTGANAVLIRVGTSGGLASSGYLATYSRFTTGVVTNNYTNGFGMESAAESDVKSGIFTLVRLSGNTWVGHGVIKRNTSSTAVFAGSVALGDALDRISLVRTSTDTFDAGSVNIYYE